MKFDLEEILNNSEDIDETANFLTYFLSCSEIEDFGKDDKKVDIDFKSLDEKIPVGPKSYLEPACVEAAEYLKSKNIFALNSFKTNKYMYLLLDKLSPENMEILKEKHRGNSRNYFMHYENTDYFGIRVMQNNRGNKKMSDELLNLVQDFKMQDIQRGYYNEKNFLMNICDCEKVNGLKENKISSAEVVFDIEKMDKSFRDYLKEAGYEPYYLQDEHRVYLNEFYYNAHQNFLNNSKLNEV